MSNAIAEHEVRAHVAAGVGGRARIGVFGGTFDPIHNGHLAAASWAASQLDLETVMMVLAGDPWQKCEQTVTPAEERWEMLLAACESSEQLIPNRMELDRHGPSYTVDTLEALADHGDLVLILCADAAAGLDTWHRAAEIDQLAEIAVVDRKGQLDLVGRRGWIPVEMPRIDISSTLIRERLSVGFEVAGLVPPAVEAIIHAKRMYEAAD